VAAVDAALGVDQTGGLVKHVLLADLRLENADAAAGVLSDAGFETSTASVDVSKGESVLALVEKATSLGDVTGLIHAAGVSPISGVTGIDPAR